jgi:Uma2 family endonuclease
MATAIIIEEQAVIPMDIRSLADFRRWATSDGFPERGRIDYLAGRIEVDMSPEAFFSHGGLKAEICGTLLLLVKRLDLGYLRTDRTRVSSLPADLSAEPDVVFLSHNSLAAGRVRLISRAGAPGEEYIEVEGGPDLVAEVVSDSSVKKDTERLPAAYFLAGVREFWLADGRREPFVFRIHRRGASGFEAVEPDAEGFISSAVLDCRFRLEWHRDRLGHWAFDLRQKGKAEG